MVESVSDSKSTGRICTISAFEGIISIKTSRDSVVRSVDHVATTIEMGKQIVAMTSKLIL